MITGTPVPNNTYLPIDYVKALKSLPYEHYFEAGASVAINRNKIIERARLENESLLLIDSDIVFTKDQAKRIEHYLSRYDVICGVYKLGFPPFPPHTYKDNQWYLPEKLEEVDGCGGGFLGISKQVVQTVPEPFTHIEDDWGHDKGNDVSFCERVKEHGFKIYCDPEINVGHIRPQITWM